MVKIEVIGLKALTCMGIKIDIFLRSKLQRRIIGSLSKKHLSPIRNQDSIHVPSKGVISASHPRSMSTGAQSFTKSWPYGILYAKTPISFCEEIRFDRTPETILIETPQSENIGYS